MLVVSQWKQPALMPAHQKITMPDGRVLVGPDKSLGQGAFGKVHRYTLDNQPVAVKTPIRPADNERLQHELALLKKANPHPNIIKYIEQKKVNGNVWIFMALMQGTVRDLLHHIPGLSSTTKLSIAIQLATGVAYLHNLNSTRFYQHAIVHQDLKPDNLLLDTLSDDPKIKVKISDFGMARHREQLKLPLFGEIVVKLHQGSVGGTLQYIAPEAKLAMTRRTECCELKSDVFSMGIILWEIATACRPSRSTEEIEQGTFTEFYRDKAADSKLMMQTSFFGAKTEIMTPSYPKSSFFGPIIDKCIRPQLNQRISASQTLKTLQELSADATVMQKNRQDS